MIESLAEQSEVSKNFGISAYDLPTHDKIPVIKELMAAEGAGLALDIGSGTGYTTYRVFGDRPTVCVDLHLPNLKYYKNRLAIVASNCQPLCAISLATSLPFKAGVFKFIMCSEVLEHIEEDDASVQEIARVLASDGKAVITVPYTGLGFTGFLELCGIKTVHDFPGPERHVRPGYDESSLDQLLARHGLEIDRHLYYLRLFTKVAVDAISLAHILYQRTVHHRRAWSWSEAAAAEGSSAFRLYTWFFPLLLALSRLDKLLSRRRGFGLIVAVRKRRT